VKHASLASLLTAMLAATASAQGRPPGPPPEVPPAEALATIPGLSAGQQVELRKILLERRDALESARDKARAALETQRQRDRGEIERIEEQSSERVRKLLGEESYRRYAEWRARMAPPGIGPAPRVHGPAPARGDERPLSELRPAPSDQS